MDMMPKGWDIADHFPEEVENEGLTLLGLLNTAKQFNPDNFKKEIKKIRDRIEEREAKEQLTRISEQYIYVRALDEFFELSSLTYDFKIHDLRIHDFAMISQCMMLEIMISSFTMLIFMILDRVMQNNLLTVNVVMF